MVKHILGLCLLACSCFGQAYTLLDSAFIGNVSETVRANPVMITNGLVAWWKMNDDGTSTNVLDSWSTNHLVFRGAPVWTNTGHPNSNYLNFPITGLSSGGGCLTNSTNYLQLLTSNTNFDMGTNSFSISLWFRHNRSVWKGDYLIKAIDSGGTKFIISATGYNPTTDLSFYGPRAEPFVSIPISQIQNGVWHFLVLSRDYTNYTMWLDATNVYTGSATNVYTFDPALDTVYVANHGASAYCYSVGFDGDIEEVMVRSGYALTTNDVLYLYNTYYGPPPEYVSPYPNITNNLMVYFKMNEGSSYILTNSTTNGINGWVSDQLRWTANGHNHKYALNFGQGGYASTANLVGYNVITNDTFTFAMWFCHTGTVGGFDTVFYKNTSAYDYPNPQLLRFVAGGGTDVFDWKSLGSGEWKPFNFQPYNNKWVFFVMTKEFGGLHTWYMCHDGQIDSTTYTYPDYENVPTSGAQYTIGTFSSNYWRGYIEEFRIHRNYCLSSNEVWYLYNRYYNP